MTDKGKIGLIYGTVGVVSVLVIGMSIWIGKVREERYGAEPLAVEIGKEEPDVLLTLQKDLSLVNQKGEEVKLSDLDDKVWVVNQFFANCPLCLKQNSEDLIGIYEEFRDHPDFQMVSITVDPERDTVEDLANYAEAVGAQGEDWWFVRGDKEQVYRYLTEEMKFAPIVERPEAVGAERFGHDFGIQVYGRGRRLVRQRDLFSARSFGDDVHEVRFNELRERIALRLEQPLEPDAGAPE